MSGIQLEKVTKRFRGGVVAVNEVDLTIEPGEFVVLVGPSGCGKSTLLRMIAGLEPVSSGTIRIGGNDVTDDLPQRRDIAMVFQSYALYPRMTVRRNLAFGLRMRGTAKQELERRVTEVAEILGLTHLLDRRPAALSGGQRQRVAMGRAIVREPQAFLMDEPLSNLDAKLRVSMRAQLTLLHQRLSTTTVYVTHDQIEAMTLGQRVAVLRDGLLQQYDTPQRLFRHPANLFVAAFIGSPSMNFTQVTAVGGAVDLAGVRLPAPVGDGPVVLGIRPTAFAPASREGWPTLSVIPQVVEDLGDERMVIFELDSPPVDTDAVRAAFDASDRSDLALLGEAKARFTARVPGDVPVTVGEPLALAVDPSRLYFFDTQSGAAIGG